MNGFGIRRKSPQFVRISAGAAIVTASTTAFAPSGNTGNFNATENNRQFIFGVACVASDLTLITGTNQPASGNVIYTLRKNGVDTAITITIAANAAAGTFSDSTHTVSFGANDLVSLKAVNNATGNSSGLISWSIKTT